MPYLHHVKTGLVLLSLCVQFVALGARGETRAWPQDSEPRDSTPAAVRCAIDVGSGTTKLKLARVDTVSGRISQVIFEEDIKVPYRADMGAGTTVPARTIDVGVEAILALKTRAVRALLATSTQTRGIASVDSREMVCRAVARAALRDAENRKEIVDKIEKATGITVRILSQDEEAVLGMYAAAISASTFTNTTVSPLDLVVWDISGASLEITILRPGEKLASVQRHLIFKENIGAESLKKYIVEEIQKRKSNSPNPIKVSDSERALKYVRKIASRIDPEIRHRLDNPQAVVVGIGPVHGRSITEQLRGYSGSPYTLEQVSRALAARLGKTDAQVGGAFADTQVVNLILVRGFMESLRIKQVVPVDINVTQAVLLNPEFWKI